MTHTALPWNTDSRAGATNIESANRRLVANTGGYMDNMSNGAYHYENEANAALIIRAVNAHDALIETMQSVLFFVDTLAHVRGKEFPTAANFAKAMTDALQLAKGA